MSCDSSSYTDCTGISNYCLDTTSGIAPDLSGNTNTKLILLCKVENAIAGLLTNNTAEYQIGSRRIKKNNLNDLIALRDKLKAELYGGIQVNYICIE